MFCCAILCVNCSFAIILMGKRELVALLNLSSWCLALFYGAMRLSAFCECGISRLYSLLLMLHWVVGCCTHVVLLTQRRLSYSTVGRMKFLHLRKIKMVTF